MARPGEAAGWTTDTSMRALVKRIFDTGKETYHPLRLTLSFTLTLTLTFSVSLPLPPFGRTPGSTLCNSQGSTER